MNKFEKYSAIILAGGKSSRIGIDKALLKIGNKKIIEIIYEKLSASFSNVLVIANKINDYTFLTEKIFSDVYPNFGPLSGIHSGLLNSSTNFNFFISCDTPLFKIELVRYIIEQHGNFDITIPKSGINIHSLFAVYNKSCLSFAENLLVDADRKINEKGKTKVKLFDLINNMKTNFLELSDEENITEQLFNMNTIEEYNFVKSILEKK